MRFYVRFDLSSIPPNAEIVSAKVSLTGAGYYTDSGSACSPSAAHRLIVRAVYLTPDGNWSECGVSYLNDVGPEAECPDQACRTAPYSSGTETGVVNNVWTKELVQGWLTNPSTNHGFFVWDDQTNNPTAGVLRIWSRENVSNRPKLEVTYCVP